jgi:glucose-6-phosphate 1-dehydrogenase
VTAEPEGLAPASPGVIAEVDAAAQPRNPLRDPRDRRIPRVAGPCVLVMFGVTGDLARKKLMPAVYDLANRGLLPPGFSFVGFARRDWADEDFAQVTYQAVKEYARTPFRDAVWEQLSEGVRFVSGSFSDDAAFDELAECVHKLDAERGTGGNYAFYLSIPPSQFPTVVQQLKRSGLSDSHGRGWRRVVIEKPFGHDLASARELNATLDGVFPPEAVFRIDHYLGKETVQNILALRFANEMYEPIWNRGYVDHVQITMAEDIGIGGRAGYYDGIGAARDVMQNHLLQLLALTAMGSRSRSTPTRCGWRRRRCCPRSGCPPTWPRAPRAGSTPRAGRAGARWAASWRRTASRRIRGLRRTPRCGSASIPGAGPECRSTCAPANGCRAA